MKLTQQQLPAVSTRLFPALFAGLLIVVLGIVGFGGWAATAQISSAVVSSGTLKVLSSRKRVQTPQAGVVANLRVKNGDWVEADQVLVQLDRTRARAALNVAQSGYDLSRATVARLRAERDGLRNPRVPSSLVLRMDDRHVREIVEGQAQLFKARRRELLGQASMMSERVAQLNAEIDGLEAQVEAKSQQMAIVQSELVDLDKLLAKGLVPRLRVLGLRREASRLGGEKSEHEAGIARARRLIAETKLEALQLRKTFDKSVRDELARQEADMYTLADKLQAARHAYEQMDVRATDQGIIVGLNVHTAGEVVEAAATLLEIVPVKDNLVIETHIKTVDVDNVAVGQLAEVVFSAFPQDKVPKLSGQVSYVSADALSDPQSPTLFYKAHITLSKDELAKAGDIKLLPGMPADVFVRTGERSPLSYLVDPLKRSLDRAWREP